MTHSKSISGNRPAGLAGKVWSGLAFGLVVAGLGWSPVGVLAQNSLSSRNLGRDGILAGNGTAHSEIVFTDSQGAVLIADPAAGSPTPVAVGQKLVQPLGICVGANGEYFITDTGSLAVIGLDPRTGSQRVVSTGGMLGVPFGIAAEPSGTILVANAQVLVRIDPASGAQSVVSSNGFFKAPLAATVAPAGDIYVVDALGAVIRVDSDTGAQTLVSCGGYLKRPQGIAVQGDSLYVTDVATPDGNFGVGRIIQLNRQTGVQTVLSQGNLLVGPVGITLDDAGQLVVGDPYTINENSPDLFDGGIIRVDRVTGAQNLVARGQNDFVNPRCVAVVHSAGPAASNP